MESGQDIHPSLLQRKIIHFDMDAFYASVEVRDNPELKGKPIVIGGSPQSRGVVCTASYEARKFGIRSAMPCSQAYRLCPSALFIRPDFTKYKAASTEIRAIFQRYTDRIEPLSLDEAYLDVTQNRLGIYATKLALRIQKEIADELHLTGSAGVAPNKLIAKIASDINKPNGLAVVLPEQVSAFMENLPLRRIHGIGPASEKRLLDVGLRVCRDVWAWPLVRLEDELGENMGNWLYKRSRGWDERPVETQRERKSLGREETFSSDILDVEKLKEELHSICLDLAASLKSRGLSGKTVTLKVKYADFTLSTRSQTLSEAIDGAEDLEAIASRLLLSNTEAGKKRIRLLGVSVGQFYSKSSTQLAYLNSL